MLSDDENIEYNVNKRKDNKLTGGKLGDIDKPIQTIFTSYNILNHQLLCTSTIETPSRSRVSKVETYKFIEKIKRNENIKKHKRKEIKKTLRDPIFVENPDPKIMINLQMDKLSFLIHKEGYLSWVLTQDIDPVDITPSNTFIVSEEIHPEYNSHNNDIIKTIEKNLIQGEDEFNINDKLTTYIYGIKDSLATNIPGTNQYTLTTDQNADFFISGNKIMAHTDIEEEPIIEIDATCFGIAMMLMGAIHEIILHFFDNLFYNNLHHAKTAAFKEIEEYYNSIPNDKKDNNEIDKNLRSLLIKSIAKVVGKYGSTTFERFQENIHKFNPSDYKQEIFKNDIIAFNKEIGIFFSNRKVFLAALSIVHDNGIKTISDIFIKNYVPRCFQPFYGEVNMETHECNYQPIDTDSNIPFASWYSDLFRFYNNYYVRSKHKDSCLGKYIINKAKNIFNEIIEHHLEQDKYLYIYDKY